VVYRDEKDFCIWFLESAKFVEGLFFYFLIIFLCSFTVDLAVGNATDLVSQGSRRRREVGDHVTNVYSLAEGAFHLARGKREEKRGKDLDKSGT